MDSGLIMDETKMSCRWWPRPNIKLHAPLTVCDAVIDTGTGFQATVIAPSGHSVFASRYYFFSAIFLRDVRNLLGIYGNSEFI